MSEKVKPRAGIGLFVFVLVIVMLIFAAAPIQAEWGMWGLAVTELLLLAAGIVPALILKWDLKEIFPVRRPALRQIFGVLVLWGGGYIALFPIDLIILYLFPQGMYNVSTQMLDLFKSVPFPVTFIIVAVMPAVCEEALHRGFILHTFKGTNKWAAIISMGIIFGIFHLDPYRFLGTAVLGVLLTYIMVETRNILLPILFHFVNNFLSTLFSLISVSSPEAVQIPLISVGIFLVIAAIVPFLLIGGSRLLKPKEENRSRPVSRRVWFTAIALSVVLAVTGIGITAVSAESFLSNFLPGEPVLETSFSANVNKDSLEHELEFTVEKTGSYFRTLSIEGSGLLTQVVITDGAGQEVYNVTCESMTSEGPMDLKAGEYLVTISFLTDSTDYKPVSVDMTIR